MKEIIYIFIGGGMGSVTRYLTQIAVNERLSPALFPFPCGTFAVNIIGSLLIGKFLLVGKCIQWDRTFGLTVRNGATTLTGCTFLIVGFIYDSFVI